MGSQPGSKRLICFDSLRGLGSLVVLANHIKHHGNAPSKLNYLITLPIDLGYIAIWMFVVISGFCIHLSTARNRFVDPTYKPNWLTFWKKRFRRLYPPYVIAVVFALILLPFVELHYSTRTSFLPDLTTHLLMIHSLFPAYIFGLGNPSFWTLGMEEQLYAMYSMFVKIRIRFSIEVSVTVAFVTSIIWVVVFSVLQPVPHGTLVWWGAWPLTFWFCWTLGAYAAEIYVGNVKPRSIFYSWKLGLALSTIGFVTADTTMGMLATTNTLLAYDHSGWLQTVCKFLPGVSNQFFAAAFFIWINLIVFREKEGKPNLFPAFLAKLGIISYSFYLLHEPIAALIQRYFFLQDSTFNILLRYIVISPICIFAGWTFFHLVEKRFLNTKNFDFHEKPKTLGANP